jgi:hypothetical protein
MGGRGSGGFRLGAGERPEVAGPTDTPLPTVPEPVDLTDDERVVWQELAPHAQAQRTLTAATATRFRLLCRAVVLEGKYEAKILADGLTYIAVTVDGAGNERETLKAHPLCGAHRGMMQRVESGMVAFRLAPIGKPLANVPEEKPKSALEKLQARNLRAV